MSKKFLKAGILLGILVIPAFVFVFLNTFGENRFDLPYYFPVLDESGKIVMSEGDTVFHQAPDFVLTAQDGDTFRLNDLARDIKVVNFFFSRCGTICPLMNSTIDRVARNFKDKDPLHFLSVTVDPEFDTPEILRNYARDNQYHLQNRSFLTGDKSYIYDLAIRGFKLPVADASMYDAEVRNIDEQFIHSEKVLLLDGQNYIRGIYDGVDKEDAERLKLEIKVLLDLKEKE